MRLCLDISSIGVPHERWTGVARMTWKFVELLRNAPSLDLRFSASGSLHAQDMVCHNLSRVGLADRFVGKSHSPAVKAMLRYSAGAGAKRRLANVGLRAVNYARFPLALREARELDAYFSFYAGIPRQLRNHASLRCGIYVHDVIPFLMPQYCSDKQREVLGRILRSIQPEDLVVVNSECTRRDLAQYLDWEKNNIHIRKYTKAHVDSTKEEEH